MSFNLKRERRWLAALGVALGASGLLRYSTQNEFTRLTEGLLIAGGILIVAALALSFQELGSFFGHRSTKLGTNTLTLTLMVIVILGLVNYFGARHSKQVDLTQEKLFTLSDQTQQVLGNLKQDVDVIQFATQPDPQFKDLADEYHGINSHVHYREVDPQQNPEVAHQYNVTQLNKTVVAIGAHNETIDGSTEQDLTNAILKLTRNNVKTICFLQGHGEKSIDGDDAEGYKSMVDVLTGEGYTTKAFNLVSAGEVPSDCSALVVAGPKQPLFPQESQLIDKYLDNGGKVLLLLDPETDPKLEGLLAKWNIDLGSNVVVDASGYGRLVGTGPAVPLVVNYGESPITRNFNGTMTLFPLARTVNIANRSNPEAQQEVELLKTSERSFTVPNLNVREVHFDPATDKAGPLNLGVSAERAINSSGAAGAKNARLVVIGNSEFATNKYSGLQRNGDLFLNAVHWLAEDEDLISIRPKSPTNRRVIITDTQQRELYWLSMVFLPGIVMLSGVFLWLRRR